MLSCLDIGRFSIYYKHPPTAAEQELPLQLIHSTKIACVEQRVVNQGEVYTTVSMIANDIMIPFSSVQMADDPNARIFRMNHVITVLPRWPTPAPSSAQLLFQI